MRSPPSLCLSLRQRIRHWRAISVADTGSGSVSLNDHCLNVFISRSTRTSASSTRPPQQHQLQAQQQRSSRAARSSDGFPKFQQTERGTPRPAFLAGLSPDLLHLLCRLHPLLWQPRGRGDWTQSYRQKDAERRRRERGEAESGSEEDQESVGSDEEEEGDGHGRSYIQAYEAIAHPVILDLSCISTKS